MLATFVIGLREGLEAALIVGIVAAFLKQRGGSRGPRLGLDRRARGGTDLPCRRHRSAGRLADLPQRQQEGLETVIGAVAVVMVTYMVVWMRRHSRELKGQLEGAAGSALAQGSAKALVAMAFLAVLREGRRRPSSCSRLSMPAATARPPASVPCSASSSPRCSAAASTAAACGSTSRGSSAPPAWSSCSSRPDW